MYWDDYVFKYLAMPAVAVIIIFTLVMVFVYLPVGFYTEAKCLEAGYPKSAVAWNLKTYCMNLDGSVTVRVDSVPE